MTGLSDPNGLSSEEYSQRADLAEIPFLSSMTTNMLFPIKGDLSVGGTVYFGGDFNFGDASTDDLTINGDLVIADNRYIHLGTGEDVSLSYDETTNDRFEIASKCTDFMFQVEKQLLLVMKLCFC